MISRTLSVRSLRLLVSLLALAVMAKPAWASTSVTRCDSKGVTVVFDFGPVVLRDVAVPGVEGKIIELPDCVRFQDPGLPDLPQLRTMCGIAQQGEIDVSVSTGAVEEIGDIDVAPAPAYDAQGIPRYEPAPCYGRDDPWPAPLVVVEDLEILREVRVARLLVSPVQYNPVKRTVRIFHQLTVNIGFRQPAQTGLATFDGRPDPFETLYPVMLVNSNTAKAWKTGMANSGIGVMDHSTASFFDRSAVWVKVKIESSGVYRVTYDDLKRLGVNPNLIDPRTFQLFNVGPHDPDAPCPDTMIEVALQVQGETDSSFDRNDYLMFYGRSLSDWSPARDSFVTNLYARYNAYWLTWGADQGRRMVQAIGTPRSEDPVRNSGNSLVRVEQDRECPARSGLLWIWNIPSKIGGAPSLSSDYDLGLSYPVRLCSITGRLFSTIKDTNHLNFYLNGQFLDSASVDYHPYFNPHRLRMNLESLPGLVLDTGRSIMTLELAGDSAMQVYVDFYNVAYVRRLRLGSRADLSWFASEPGFQSFSVSRIQGQPVILNIDDPYHPRLITEEFRQGDSVVFHDLAANHAGYIVTTRERLRAPASIERRTPGRLRSDNWAADYIIVAPDHLFDAAQALQRFRSNNVSGILSASARTVRLNEVYDDFAFGLEEPQAIKQLFAAKRPGYGVLLGDATYDCRDVLGLHQLPGVPPYETGYDLDPTVYSMNAVALDCWFADFDGTGYTPDMFLGRVTARTPAELTSFIQKLVKYETDQRGVWCKRGILLADDEFEGAPSLPDPIGMDHTSYCEIISSLWGSGFDPAKVYLTEYPLTSVKDKPAARARLTEELQRGGLLMSFFGHGSGDNLTHENAGTIRTVAQYTNQGRSPFCFFGSCSVGRWEDTKSECIAEEMVRKSDGGAIAAVGASKSSSSYSNLAFAQRLYGTLLEHRDLPVGPAYAASLGSGINYHLFGDPATVLAFPDSGGRLTLDPDTIRSGLLTRYGGSLPFALGYTEATLFGNSWLRTYNSPNRRLPQATYIITGSEFFRGAGRVRDGVFGGSFVTPSGVERGTHLVSDGSYMEVGVSSHLSLVAWQGSRMFGLSHDGVRFDTAFSPGQDRTGPQVRLFADGRELSALDTNIVNPNFTLTGRLTDTSGILISPVPSGDVFFLYVGDYRNRVPLNNMFLYDVDSHTSGSFSCPVTVGADVDSIVVVAADNFLNRTSLRVIVRALPDEQLSVHKPLVYPNPVNSQAWFTFELSAPAAVQVKIHSLSGRLLRTLELLGGVIGYNQLNWDGCDASGTILPNGVYLYSVTARRDGSGSNAQRASVNERFVVRR